jgi:hydrogenase-1 operon protein HyaF
MSSSTELFTGAGSQPSEEDGAELQYMTMPEGMMTFVRPSIPEPEDTAELKPALALMERVLGGLQGFRRGDPAARFDLSGLDAANLRFIDQMLGDGEVGIVAGSALQIQESVMAGLWRVRQIDAEGRLADDAIAVGHVPAGVCEVAAALAERLPNEGGPAPRGLESAPALLSEIADVLTQDRGEPYAINLSLLPHTEADLAWLAERLGPGIVVVLSRGYGNCRISSTGTRHVWWVQYFNSQDALILNTIEITPIPEVACAAIEDIEDSAERLNEILEIYR